MGGQVRSPMSRAVIVVRSGRGLVGVVGLPRPPGRRVVRSTVEARMCAYRRNTCWHTWHADGRPVASLSATRSMRATDRVGIGVMHNVATHKSAALHIVCLPNGGFRISFAIAGVAPRRADKTNQPRFGLRSFWSSEVAEPGSALLDHEPTPIGVHIIRFFQRQPERLEAHHSSQKEAVRDQAVVQRERFSLSSSDS